jgi:hypothetical protein
MGNATDGGSAKHMACVNCIHHFPSINISAKQFFEFNNFEEIKFISKDDIKLSNLSYPPLKPPSLA